MLKERPDNTTGAGSAWLLAILSWALVIGGLGSAVWFLRDLGWAIGWPWAFSAVFSAIAWLAAAKTLIANNEMLRALMPEPDASAEEEHNRREMLRKIRKGEPR